MAFIESPVFPITVSFHSQFGPRWSTDVVMTNSGQETRNINWAQPLQTASVSFDARRPERITAVRQWFYLTKGMGNGFRVRDWGDYEVPDLAGTGVLTLISGANYQLYKRYTLGATSFDRKIVKPDAAQFALYDAGVLKTLTTHYTIDAATGVVSILFAPAGALTWTGQFHVAMRFDADVARIQQIDRNLTLGLIEGTQDLPLIELRL